MVRNSFQKYKRINKKQWTLSIRSPQLTSHHHQTKLIPVLHLEETIFSATSKRFLAFWKDETVKRYPKPQFIYFAIVFGPFFPGKKSHSTQHTLKVLRCSRQWKQNKVVGRGCPSCSWEDVKYREFLQRLTKEAQQNMIVQIIFLKNNHYMIVLPPKIVGSIQQVLT